MMTSVTAKLLAIDQRLKALDSTELQSDWHCLAHERLLITQARAIVAPSLLRGTISGADWLWCLVHKHDVGALNHENHLTNR